MAKVLENLKAFFTGKPAPSVVRSKEEEQRIVEQASAAQRRVVRGAGLLDLVNPTWADQIDLDKLDIADVRNCVLGQLYGTYGTGVDKLTEYFSGDYMGREYGFIAGRFSEPNRVTSDALTQAWKELIPGLRS